MLYKSLLRPILFNLSAEKAHHFTFTIFKLLLSIPLMKALHRKIYQVKSDHLKRELFGLEFPNPVGLAAGFDKDAKLFNELACLGFGFIEIGTLTPKAQEGNPKPRLFRLPEDQALINRMGFNNEGVSNAVQRLKKRSPNLIIGGNIGKNKVTPNEEALNDYVICFHELYPVVDYFVVNVSSPNTPNLRELQEKEPLKKLLLSLKEVNAQKEKEKPILLKIAPDLTQSQLQDIVDILKETKISGIIASNTTISRDGLATSRERIEEIGAGGLSGKPLKDRSTEVISFLSKNLGSDFPIIGVGGISSPQDAEEKLKAGASLVQIYTGFIYEGPSFVKKINQYLLEKA